VIVGEIAKMVGNASMIVPPFLVCPSYLHLLGQSTRILLILCFYYILYFSFPLLKRLGPALVLNAMDEDSVYVHSSKKLSM
jgi:hypothetical protein